MVLVGFRVRSWHILWISTFRSCSFALSLTIIFPVLSITTENEGNRQEICDLLLESQYILEGASMAQLNQVVSGALDRLHYEDDACVRYDSETKHWCYLHNERKLTEFKTPSWAASDKRGEPRRKKVEEAAVGGGKPNSEPNSEPKKEQKNESEEAPEDTPKEST